MKDVFTASKVFGPLQIIQSDLCGPLQLPSITGNRYLITFIDDFTRFTIIYFMKNKAPAFNALKANVNLKLKQLEQIMVKNIVQLNERHFVRDKE